MFAVASLSDQVPSPYLFRNFEITDKTLFAGTQHATIIDALRASTAAPVYFRPIIVGNTTLKDGGLVANNPTMIALLVARALFGQTIRIVLSVGTGSYSCFSASCY